MSVETNRPTHRGGSDQLLALNLAAAVRTAAYYDSENAVMQQVWSTLGSLLGEYTEEAGSTTVGVHSRCVFVGKSRVRSTLSTYERFSYLIGLYERWGIHSVTFFAGVSEDELMNLTHVLARDRGSGPEDLAARLHDRGVRRVEVNLSVRGDGPQAVAPAAAYVAAAQMGKEMREHAAEGKPASTRRLRHVTQAVVDQIIRDPHSLVALTTLKEFDSYLISHSTNVAILAVLLGQRLGLSKSKLGELCLAAFLHDAGKLEVAPDVLFKPGPLDPDEWEEIRNHPVMAARALLSGPRLTAPGMRAVVVAFEHHLNYDMSGYPRTTVKDCVSLFGNIVTIADRYDALTTPRVYRKTNFTPREALHYLISHAGTYFDPALVKLFVEIMGLYPPGTLVSLSDGGHGVVCEPPVVGRPLDRPKVRITRGTESGTVIDLDQREGDRYARSVVAVLNPGNMGQVPAVDISLFDAANYTS